VAKTSTRNAKAEPVDFPNPSRSYDETRRGVLFWGYDQALEISFVNRDRICAVAGKIYSRRHKASHIFSFTLTDAGF
jgi:hypothetical protein